jgi:hypothetical protein
MFAIRCAHKRDRPRESDRTMILRLPLLFMVLAAVLATAHARAEGVKPTDVTVGPVTLQIVEPESGEKELRHGTRVLVKEFSINEGLAAKFKDTSARVFDVGPGGNACDGWPAVVTVEKGGKVAIDLTMRDLCSLYVASTDEEGFTFVEKALPGTDGSVWRFTPEDGMRRLGVLVFRPQPNSTWNDLDRMLDHPLSLFNVAPFDAAVRKLTGAQFREFALRLNVAGGVEKKDERFLVGTGCQAHACNSDQGFVGIDRKSRAIFLAMRSGSRMATWPAPARWPAPLREDYETWRKVER